MTLAGVLVSLELIMRDCFTMAVFGGDQELGYFALAGLLLCVVLPLSLLPKMSLLSKSSLLSILAILYMIGVLVFMGGRDAHEHPQSLQPRDVPFAKLLSAAPVIVYSLGCQVQAVPLFQELPKEGRGVNVFLLCVAVPAMLLCVALFATTGLFGMLATYPHTQGDVLRSLPSAFLPARVAQLAVGVSLALVTPLMLWPIRTAVLNIAKQCQRGARGSGSKQPHPGLTDEESPGRGHGGPLAAPSLPVRRLPGGGLGAALLHPPAVRLTVNGTAEVQEASLDPSRDRVVGPGAPSQGWMPPSPVPGQRMQGAIVRSHVMRSRQASSDARVSLLSGQHGGPARLERQALSMSGSSPGASSDGDVPRRRSDSRSMCSWWWWERTGVTLAILAVSFGIAVGVPSVLTVFRIVGATAGTFLFYLYPAMVYLKLTSMVHAAPQGAPVTPDAAPHTAPAGSFGLQWVDGDISISSPVVGPSKAPVQGVIVSADARMATATESDTDAAGGDALPAASMSAQPCGLRHCSGVQYVPVHSCARAGAYALLLAGICIMVLSLYSVIDGFVTETR